MKLKDITLPNILQFNIGMFRYKLLEKAPRLYLLLIRKHIRQQIEMRLLFVLPACFNSAACVKCGCMTPALQFADKTCDGLCYPEMMPRKLWDRFRIGYPVQKGYIRWRITDKGNLVTTNTKNNMTYETNSKPDQRSWYYELLGKKGDIVGNTK